jgi:ribosome-binding ATPase
LFLYCPSRNCDSLDRFIRAEAIGYEDLVTAGSEKSAKEKGVLRSEGKEYVVREGDVLLFRFNV